MCACFININDTKKKKQGEIECLTDIRTVNKIQAQLDDN